MDKDPESSCVAAGVHDVQMAEINIPEEVGRSFEELWQEYRSEIENAETAALSNSLTDVEGTPIIKVIPFQFFFPFVSDRRRICSITENLELILT